MVCLEYRRGRDGRPRRDRYLLQRGTGSISIQSTDDCINAANADLSGYSYELNIFGGTTEMPDKKMQNGQSGTGGQPNGKEPPSGEERPDGEERPAQGGFGGQKPDGSTPPERQEGEDSQNNGSDTKT